jgi:GT2 family glycosyltransferase
MHLSESASQVHGTLTLSIVSHGHGHLLHALLHDIQNSIDLPYRVILTLNIPEDEGFLQTYSSMPIQVLRNSKPRGFGQNHNRAFQYCTDSSFVIVNPDIRGTPFILEPLIRALANPQIGASGPLITSSQGITQDSARRFPTIRNLLARKLGSKSLDYTAAEGNQSVDWLAGMLIAFNSAAYRTVGGFDEGYFMYVEDVDIAWRMRRAGYASIWVPSVSFIHDAQHGSRTKGQHLIWHCQSMLRFFLKKI